MFRIFALENEADAVSDVSDGDSVDGDEPVNHIQTAKEMKGDDGEVVHWCRSAKSIFERISYHASSDTSLINCWILTGRTHQIRVHLQSLNHPIVNDPLYGEPVPPHYQPASAEVQEWLHQNGPKYARCPECGASYVAEAGKRQPMIYLHALEYMVLGPDDHDPAAHQCNCAKGCGHYDWAKTSYYFHSPLPPWADDHIYMAHYHGNPVYEPFFAGAPNLNPKPLAELLAERTLSPLPPAAMPNFPIKPSLPEQEEATAVAVSSKSTRPHMSRKMKSEEKRKKKIQIKKVRSLQAASTAASRDVPIKSRPSGCLATQRTPVQPIASIRHRQARTTRVPIDVALNEELSTPASEHTEYSPTDRKGLQTPNIRFWGAVFLLLCVLLFIILVGPAYQFLNPSANDVVAPRTRDDQRKALERQFL